MTPSIDSPEGASAEAFAQCPPPAAMPEQGAEEDAARGKLNRLANELRRAGNRRALVEFLTLRRSLR